jgi:hypothetical protein
LNGRIEEMWPSRLKEETNASDSETRSQHQPQQQDAQHFQVQHQQMQMMMIPRLAAAFQVINDAKCQNFIKFLGVSG